MTDDSVFEPTIRRNAETGTIHVQCDWSDPRPISTCIVAVVRTVPELEFADDQRLFDAVDSEALDAPFEPTSGDCRRSGGVRIGFRRFSLTVYGDGELVFDPQAANGSAEPFRFGSSDENGSSGEGNDRNPTVNRATYWHWPTRRACCRSVGRLCPLECGFDLGRDPVNDRRPVALPDDEPVLLQRREVVRDRARVQLARGPARSRHSPLLSPQRACSKARGGQPHRRAVVDRYVRS
ncbi:HalOD1 output domain-containing protein [Natronobacterium lacisalsi]